MKRLPKNSDGRWESRKHSSFLFAAQNAAIHQKTGQADALTAATGIPLFLINYSIKEPSYSGIIIKLKFKCFVFNINSFISKFTDKEVAISCKRWNYLNVKSEKRSSNIRLSTTIFNKSFIATIKNIITISIIRKHQESKHQRLNESEQWFNLNGYCLKVLIIYLKSKFTANKRQIRNAIKTD